MKNVIMRKFMMSSCLSNKIEMKGGGEADRKKNT